MSVGLADALDDALAVLIRRLNSGLHILDIQPGRVVENHAGGGGHHHAAAHRIEQIEGHHFRQLQDAVVSNVHLDLAHRVTGVEHQRA